MTPPSGFNPPLQDRSEKTLERLLDAARAALTRKSFDELTLAELTEEAGVTVGAFYQRFPSKAALLEHLEDEMYERIREGGASLFRAPPSDDQRTIGDVVRAYVTQMAHTYQEHRGVMRELVQRSRSDDRRQRERTDMTRDVVAGAVDWILLHRGTIGHPHPKRALSIALLFVTAALRDVILFDETWAGPESELGIDVLVEELVRAVEAYLRLTVDA
jgi:AcrR family transcriptional regulator